MTMRRGGLVERVFGRKVPTNFKAKLGQVNKRIRGESKQGVVDISKRWTDEQPHPSNMTKYEDLNKDSEVSTAITMLTDMIAGVGYHLEDPEGVETPEGQVSPEIKLLNKYGEDFNLDEKFSTIVRTAFEKGFCPVERLTDGDLKILPPETFKIWRHPTGEVYKYTQKVGNSVVATWKEGEDLDDIILFVRLESPTRPYGKALVEDIADRIDMRRQMAEDVPQIIHKYGYPFRVWMSENETIGDTVFEQATGREIDQDIFLENILKDQLTIHTEPFAHRIDFTPYVTHNDEMIAEGLMAPLLLYLKNSTEASAHVQMEAIERSVEGAQRYYARRIEKYVFTPMLGGKKVPRLIWGPSETGLEDITFEGIAALYNGGSGAITFQQAQTLLKELGAPIGEIQEEPTKPSFTLPPNPLNPTQDQELYVLEANYRAQKISLTEALDGGRRLIELNVTQHRNKTIRELEVTLGKKPDPISEESEKHFELLRNELFNTFKNKLLVAGVKR